MLLLSGCAADLADGDDVGTAELAALTANSLTANALTSSAPMAARLPANALTADGLMHDAEVAAALEDPNARSFLKYVVGCALPAEESFEIVVDGASYTYSGRSGLAPEWGKPGGSCGASCQAWVSGCVLSRVNHLGVTVPLSIRGEHPALALSPGEHDAYPRIEATYYGNVFSTTQTRHACLPPGHATDERVCGPSIHGCVIDFVGSCDWACGPVGASGDYTSCHDAVRGTNGTYPPGTTTFPGSVTVYLQ
ncbi:Hypothetical protein A7982_11112 [Minicystis rosea]|nr:Hypothetical protein A7982_11112 [Minicystis rosea]